MINLNDKPINVAVTVTAKISGTIRPVDLVLVKDGSAATESITFVSLTQAGLSNFTFTPGGTGLYTLYGDGQVLATIDVVTRTSFSYLQNLEDESLGSWQWNKTTGELTLLRQNGTQLAVFNVVDSLVAGSRERI